MKTTFKEAMEFFKGLQSTPLLDRPAPQLDQQAPQLDRPALQLNQSMPQYDEPIYSPVEYSRGYQSGFSPPVTYQTPVIILPVDFSSQFQTTSRNVSNSGNHPACRFFFTISNRP